MKILVIGHTVEDYIHYPDRLENKPGGIFYSTSGFRFIKEDDDEILLCTSVTESKKGLFSFVYDSINNKYFDDVDAIPTIHLNIIEGKERHEKYENITDRINLKYDPADEPDGIFINMITGFDITIEDIKKLRKTFSVPIYIDLHSLCRGIEEGYKRNFRQIPDFKTWAESVDIIQCNENEVFTISDKTSEQEIAKEVLSYGPKYLVVTKGASGTRLYSLANNELASYFIPSLKVNAINKVGCGDVFGATFFYSYLKERDVIKALRLGNTAAGVLSTYKEITKIKDLKK